MKKPSAIIAGLVLCAGPYALAGQLEPGALNLPSGPASIRGLADDATIEPFSGSLSYAIDFAFPKGPGGITPALSLGYRGELGNGAAGIGWHLTIPRIERSTRLGVPSFSSADELNLVQVGGGGTLVRAADGTYRIEGRGQTVKAVFDTTTDTWRVYDGTGSVFYLGTTVDHRESSSRGTTIWFVEAVELSNGQRVEYEYQRYNSTTSNALDLKYVRWGAGRLEARLDYVARPDAFVSHRSGLPLRYEARLDSLHVFADGIPVRSYQLGYDDVGALSRLVSVTQVGRDGTTSMPTTTFGYGQLAATGQTDTVCCLAPGWSLTDPQVLLIDVDADGFADVLNTGVTPHSYQRNLGQFLDIPQPLPTDSGLLLPPLSQARIMEMKGKAKPDFVEMTFQGWRIHALESGQWVSAGLLGNTSGLGLNASSYAFGDVNGDGRSDLLLASGGHLRVRLNEGTQLGAVLPALGPPGLTPQTPGIEFQDMNGDGLLDIVESTFNGFRVHVGYGDGGFDFPYSISTSGLPSYDTLDFRDLDYDGVTDIVLTTASQVRWYPLRPDGSYLLDAAGARVRRTLPRPYPNGVAVSVSFADTNGNGSVDVVWNALGTNGNRLYVLDLAGSVRAGMVTSIDNGMGKRVEYDYTSSGQLWMQAELSSDPNAAWDEKLPISVPVVQGSRTTLASGEPPRQTQIDVSEGFYDVDERRFGGFLHSVVTEVGSGPATTKIVTTGYNAGRGVDRVLRGRPYFELVRDGNGRLFTAAYHTWSATELTTLSAPDPRLRLATLTETRQYVYEGTFSPIELKTNYGYDGYGNQNEVIQHGRTDRLGDETYSTVSYTQNLTRWLHGQPYETRRSDSASSSPLEHKRIYYDGTSSGPLPLGQVSSGWKRQVQQYYTAASRWVTLEEEDYDTYGNVTWSRKDGAAHRYTYAPGGLHMTRDELEVRPGEYLTWNVQAWDIGFEAPTRVEDPNGVITDYVFDPLGRLQSVGHMGVAPHMVFDYQWTAPRPSTTSYIDDGASIRPSVLVANSAGEQLYTATFVGNGDWAVTDYVERDERGFPTYLHQPFYWTGALPNAPPAGNPKSTQAFDAVGRVVTQTDALGFSSTTQHSPLQAVSTPAGMAAVTHEYDGIGRVVRSSRVVNGVDETALATYDALGRVTDFVLQDTGNVFPPGAGSSGSYAGSVAHSYSYDTLGRLTQVTLPEGGTRRFTYSDEGLLTRVDKPAGEYVEMQYDLAGRVIEKLSSTGLAYEFYYDDAHAVLPDALANGRLARVVEPNGEIVFAYDAHGHEIVQHRTIESTTVVETRTYAPSGLLMRRDFDDGMNIVYRHDEGGRLTAVDNLWTTTLDAAGRAMVETYGNGVVQSYQRDFMGRPYEVRVDAPGPISLLDLSISRNPYGAPTSITDRDGVGVNHSAVFGYDQGGRVTSAILGGYDFTYGYDGLQRFTTRHVTGPAALSNFADGTYVYGSGGAGPRQLSQVVSASGATRTYSYDSSGRMIHADGRDLTYDGFDRLSRVKLSSGLVLHYAYGADGERSYAVDSSGAETRYFSPLLTVNDAGVREYRVSTSGRVVARVDVDQGAIRDTIYMMNGLDLGPTLLTNAYAGVLDERQNEPFGALLAGNHSLESRNRSGKPVDLETRWVDHGARWYAPEVGSWLSTDIAAWNHTPELMQAPWQIVPYTFDNNNPLIYADPDGNFAFLLTGAILVYKAYDAVSTVIDTIQTARSVASFFADPNLTMDTAIDRASEVGTALVLSAVAGALGGAIAKKGVTYLAKKLPGIQRYIREKVARVLKSRFCPGGRCRRVAQGRKGDACPIGGCGGPDSCFVAGTPVLDGAGEPVAIERIRVGDRVRTKSGQLDTKVTTDWMVIEALLRRGGEYPDVFKVELLRSPEWIVDRGARVGQAFPLAFEELSVEGLAQVIRISAVGTLAEGEGRMVLGTVTHLNDDVYEVSLAGAAPLRGTGAHRLYSVDRQDWVRVRDLQVGERLQTASGAVTIESLEKVRGTHRVYNLEVEGDHEYLAGAAAVRAHNACGDGDDELITLYRGVGDNHHPSQIRDAHKGIARPRGGTATPAEHNIDANTLSEYTSWTTDRRMARKYAKGANGVILEVKVPKSRTVKSPDRFGESEVLVTGDVTGAKVGF